MPNGNKTECFILKRLTPNGWSQMYQAHTEIEPANALFDHLLENEMPRPKLQLVKVSEEIVREDTGDGEKSKNSTQKID